MDKKSWLERWQAKDIGFHQSEINPYLQRWWSQLKVADGSRVFVPLCGKSNDMLWLLEQGYRVLGVEVSSLAVIDFFHENDLRPVVTEQAGFQCYELEGLMILCGDFFSLTRKDLSDVAAVFDRASLVALTPELRKKYSQHLLDILPAHAQSLLLTIEYEQQEMNGPPFAVMEDEVWTLFSRHFQIKPLDKNDMLEENPRFRERGVSKMLEAIYCLSERVKN